MTYADTGGIVIYLYWFLLLMVTVGSLVFAVLAYRLQKRVFAIASAGALAAALFIAAVPSVATPPAFAIMLGLVSIALIRHRPRRRHPVHSLLTASAPPGCRQPAGPTLGSCKTSRYSCASTTAPRGSAR